MTGFGTAALDSELARGAVTMRSVNHRYLDLAMHVPPRLQAMEAELKKLVQGRLRRGRVEVFVQAAASDQAPEVQIARPVIAAVVAALREVQREHGLAGDVAIADVARFPGAISVTDSAGEMDEQRRAELMLTATRALDGLESMRRAEGEKLEADLRGALEAIEAGTARIGRASADGKQQRREALATRVRTLRDELGGEDPRFPQEIVRLVERHDIEEELQRLASHVSQARGLISGDGSCGKQLDFLAQELAREANTIGSKAATADVVHEVVELKSAIERLREQVQNVE